VPNINRCKLKDLPTYIKAWMRMTPNDPAPPRALIVNLSARLRAFHSALSDAEMDERRAEGRMTPADGQPQPKTRNARKRK
jgi:hypothetical protein